MKNRFPYLQIAFTVILFMFYHNLACASGVGLSLGVGHEEWHDDINYGGGRNVINGGFLYETIVRRNKLFSYGFTFLRERNKDVSDKLNMYGWSTAQSFMFGLVRTRKVRFWVGPQVKLTFYNKLELNTNEQIVYRSGWFIDDRLGDV